eukprot:Nk52_evm108s221 gene=Nk52_evmTU108s221
MSVKEIDELRDAAKFEEALKLADEIVTSDGNNVDALWRQARCYFDLHENVDKDAKSKEAHVDKGLEIVTKAVELDDKSAGAHKWFAILTSSKGDFLGTKEKIKSAFVIKEHAEKAAELDSTDGAAEHLLGRWCYDVSNIGWATRQAAKVFFATPPESTFEEALDHFLKADKLVEAFKRNAVYVGHTYYNMKKYKDAKEWFEKAMAMPNKSPVDEELDVEAKKYAKKC